MAKGQVEEVEGENVMKQLYKITFDYFDSRSGKYYKSWTEQTGINAKDAIAKAKRGFANKKHKNWKAKPIKKSKIGEIFR